MKKFIVEVREVHVATVVVEAENAEDAKTRVANGEGETQDGLEYSHTLNPDTWTLEEQWPA